MRRKGGDIYNLGDGGTHNGDTLRILRSNWSQRIVSVEIGTKVFQVIIAVVRLRKSNDPSKRFKSQLPNKFIQILQRVREDI